MTYYDRIRNTAKAMDIAELAQSWAFPGQSLAEVLPDAAWRVLCAGKGIPEDFRGAARQIAERHFHER